MESRMMVGEGTGDPLQYSCLENPMGRGESRTRLKWLSSSSSSSSRMMVTITLYARQMYRTVFWTLWERARVGWFGRMALKHVYYYMWNKSPVQVRCMIQDARGWCTGMTRRDGMGTEVREEFRMGNMCMPVADLRWCVVEPIKYCKVISLQLK